MAQVLISWRLQSISVNVACLDPHSPASNFHPWLHTDAYFDAEDLEAVVLNAACLILPGHAWNELPGDLLNEGDLFVLDV